MEANFIVIFLPFVSHFVATRDVFRCLNNVSYFYFKLLKNLVGKTKNESKPTSTWLQSLITLINEKSNKPYWAKNGFLSSTHIITSWIKNGNCRKTEAWAERECSETTFDLEVTWSIITLIFPMCITVILLWQTIKLYIGFFPFIIKL